MRTCEKKGSLLIENAAVENKAMQSSNSVMDIRSPERQEINCPSPTWEQRLE